MPISGSSNEALIASIVEHGCLKNPVLSEVFRAMIAPLYLQALREANQS
jgi:hypothetical protein